MIQFCDRSIKVHTPEGESTWAMTYDLTDRWGNLADDLKQSEKKPVAALAAQPELLERLRSQMVGEDTFITMKDGRYGILFELEFLSQESESVIEGVLDATLPPYEAVLDELVKRIPDIIRDFPGVEVCAPHADYAYNGRPMLWAFVKDGLLDEQRLQDLHSALL